MSETKELKKRIQELLKAVKPLLPRGLSKKMMSEFGISQGYYYDIAKGRRWNLEVAEAILKTINPKKVFDIESCSPQITWEDSLSRREIKYTLRDEIVELKPLLEMGVPQEIAKAYNLSESMIYDLMEGRSWHLEAAIDLLKRCRINKARAEYLDSELQKILAQKEKATIS